MRFGLRKGRNNRIWKFVRKKRLRQKENHPYHFWLTVCFEFGRNQPGSDWYEDSRGVIHARSSGRGCRVAEAWAVHSTPASKKRRLASRHHRRQTSAEPPLNRNPQEAAEPPPPPGQGLVRPEAGQAGGIARRLAARARGPGLHLGGHRERRPAVALVVRGVDRPQRGGVDPSVWHRVPPSPPPTSHRTVPGRQRGGFTGG